ncbi:MerR family transcriptional regulator [Parageobacillus thermoglucosidasius]|uniref:MerR family transcriptional regulator n=1 Tax=Parageobacillus thermoglucosidasius TaxID=1426 RepID=UPI002E1FBFD1|nr:MerR family transcriptional regulator [Parageobacillus thermoglucosidasius]MED4915537.1 MerR family transcriptional regulator [Parageobacillus thermoglucosidasius]MED4946651.1 MerR family transcriptional regulator [Parageobacillus thermoglucosidasius]MED4984872.1 MerR family transcriptional regulator [Parageobacillus thermoglucosidasius]
MSEFMTIQTFSKRTGISKSALRYYESENLLHPIRSKNGYRLYSKDQIATVKLISSLRLAGVPIKDIRMYLKENKSVRQQMIKNWIKTLKEKHQLISVSLRFLESYQESGQVYLLERNAEKIVWFVAESNPGKFGNHFRQRKRELERLNIPINNGYLRYLSGKESIKAQIGFGVSDDVEIAGLSEIDSIEIMPPCLCIALPYTSPVTEIQKGYAQLMNYTMEHGLIPAGPIIEWYRGENFEDLDLLMPVTRISNMKGRS